MRARPRIPAGGGSRGSAGRSQRETPAGPGSRTARRAPSRPDRRSTGRSVVESASASITLSAMLPIPTVLAILGGLFALEFSVLAIHPVSRADWLLENALSV